MPRCVYETPIPGPAAELYAWHMRDGAFERLVPPWQSVQVLSRSGPVSEGSTLVMRVGPRGLGPRWVAEHHDIVRGERFTDTQRRGPFTTWSHTHRMIDCGATSVLRDEIDWSLPLSPVTHPLFGGMMRRFLDRMFHFRHFRTREDLMQQMSFSTTKPKNIAITGASGLVGQRLVPFLTTLGHQVWPLVRRLPRPNTYEIQWSPDSGTVGDPRISGMDAVIHLAGENIAQGRWNDTVKERLVQSRVTATRLLAETLARQSQPPAVLVCASAIGYYGNRNDEELDENSKKGDGFLAELTQQWENACQPAIDAGIRVVRLRIGIVLAKEGGALAKMLPAFRMGVGGPIGGGRQWMSWIAIDDLVYAIFHCVMDPAVSGPVNATAPNPVRNADFGRILGKTLHRPAIFPVPAALIRLLFGEMGQETVLSSAKVTPSQLIHTGFRFRFPTLADTLAHELGA